MLQWRDWVARRATSRSCQDIGVEGQRVGSCPVWWSRWTSACVLDVGQCGLRLAASGPFPMTAHTSTGDSQTNHADLHREANSG